MEITNKPEVWEAHQVGNRASYSRKSGYNDPTFYFVKKLIRDNILKTDSLLEIGFGDGKTLQLLSKHFKQVSGADISSGNVELTRKEFFDLKITNSNFFTLDLITAPTIDKTFDVVMLNHVLEHFTLEELKTVVPNIKRLLKPGGILLGAVPYNLPFKYLTCPKCGETYEQDGHQIRYTEDVFRTNFLHFGFNELVLRNHNFEFYSRHDNPLKKIFRKVYYSMIKESKGQLEFCLKSTHE